MNYLPKQEACPDCGGEQTHLGEDVPKMLETEPIRFKVIRQVRPNWLVRGLRTDRAGESTEPADRTRCAHAPVSKHGDHLPLYRQSEIYVREE